MVGGTVPRATVDPIKAVGNIKGALMSQEPGIQVVMKATLKHPRCPESDRQYVMV